jgi:uncharacterized protein (DUF1800 family)
MEQISRRRFFHLGGATAAAAAVPTLSVLSELQRPPLQWRARTAAEMPQPDVAALLLSRAAFGARAGDVERVRGLSQPYAWVDEQLDLDKLDVAALDERIARELPTLSMTSRQIWTSYQMQNQGLPEAELVMASLYRQVYSPRQLYEVMVEFWTDHFNIGIDNDDVRWLKTVDDRDVIRKHALGKFKDLLTASAQSPAMLRYLDNDVNFKGRPNENYGREILELHTLGAAVNGYPYTETDVKEVAKCFTGWSWTRGQTSAKWGEYEFLTNQHDNSVKSVLGQTVPGSGKNEGHLVIDILCKHPATAKYIAMKLVRRFVTDDPLGQVPQLVTRVADTFTRTDGDIKEMLYVILTSQEFARSFGSFGGRLSRPTDYMARILRASGLPENQFTVKVAGNGTYNAVITAFNAMGQRPFNWPTPDGYPDYKEAWGSSVGMLTRWNFGLLLCGVGGSRGSASLVNGFDVAGQTPATANTVGKAVDFWVDRILNRAILDEDRQALVDFISDGKGADTAITGIAADKLKSGIALVFDSSYFQWR